jgi:TonB family protein
MNAVSAIEPWEGKVVEGKYPLLELLGSGPRGAVFRTQIATPGGAQRAAIKLIPTDVKQASIELARLRAAMDLSNPYLLKIFDAGQCPIRREPTIYVVMEYAEENLAEILPYRALTSVEMQQMLPPLLDALSYLHGKGLVHGRTQPSNIMAIGDTLKLSSDSISKIGDVNNDVSTSMSDVWALGATLVAALGGESRGQPSQQQLTLVPNSIPEPFRHIARECLRPNAGDRCTLEQIKGWLSGSVRARTAEPTSPHRRRQAAKIVAVLILLVALVFGLRSLFRSGQTVADRLPAEQISRPNSSPSPAAQNNRGSMAGAVAERVIPSISQSARNTIQGKIRVAVRLGVDANGNVTDARLTTAGPSKYFANQALQSARRWKFKPPQTDGQPTSSTWLLKYQFGRGGTEVIPSEVR